MGDPFDIIFSFYMQLISQRCEFVNCCVEGIIQEITLSLDQGVCLYYPKKWWSTAASTILYEFIIYEDASDTYCQGYEIF